MTELPKIRRIGEKVHDCVLPPTRPAAVAAAAEVVGVSEVVLLA